VWVILLQGLGGDGMPCATGVWFKSMNVIIDTIVGAEVRVSISHDCRNGGEIVGRRVGTGGNSDDTSMSVKDGAT
jgi:hypothetical protein